MDGADKAHARLTRRQRTTFICAACALLLALASSAPRLHASGNVQRNIKPEFKSDVNNLPDAVEKVNARQVIEAQRVRADFAVNEFDHPAWQGAQAVRIERYWSGASAPAARQAEARVLWSETALYVRFVARQGEPLVVNDKPRLDQKTMGLWDRDVCELFVAPHAGKPERYFEFEVAPTGEWIDLGIHVLPDRRETDWQYHSGATFAARIAPDTITLTMRIPWAALGGKPAPDARWRANLFRCVGAGAPRGYLAWQPTRTEQPNFHVPQSFGWLHFKGFD